MKYALKPNPVDAFIWTGGPDQIEDPEWLVKALKEKRAEILYPGTPEMKLVTNPLEFDFYSEALPGDYVGINEYGIIFAADKEWFETNYEKAE